MDLILEKRGAFTAALQDWSTKWVPAILEYSNTVAGKKAALLSETRKAYEGTWAIMHIYSTLAIRKRVKQTLTRT